MPPAPYPHCVLLTLQSAKKGAAFNCRASSFLVVNSPVRSVPAKSPAEPLLGRMPGLEIQGQVDLRSLDQRQYLVDHGQN